MSKITKKYRNRTRFFGFLHLVLPIIACITFCVLGFANGTTTTATSMAAMFMLAVALSAINLLVKAHLTCIPYIILAALLNINLGWYPALIYGFMAYTILDDFIFRPLYIKAKSQYIASKVVDAHEQQ